MRANKTSESRLGLAAKVSEAHLSSRLDTLQTGEQGRRWGGGGGGHLTEQVKGLSGGGVILVGPGDRYADTDAGVDAWSRRASSPHKYNTFAIHNTHSVRLSFSSSQRHDPFHAALTTHLHTSKLGSYKCLVRPFCPAFLILFSVHIVHRWLLVRINIHTYIHTILCLRVCVCAFHANAFPSLPHSLPLLFHLRISAHSSHLIIFSSNFLCSEINTSRTTLQLDLQCESKNPPRGFLIFFQNGWEFLINFSYTYYTIISTLDYKFLFKYFQLWQSYAILSATI